MRIAIWFRNDLRVKDHQVLFEACQKADEVVPFYCFDDHYYQTASLGFPKIGPHRARFIKESVENLHAKLKAKGGGLVVRQGNTASELQKLHEQFPLDAIYFTEETTKEEKDLEKKVADLKIPLQSFENQALYSVSKLPFAIEDMPWVFTEFRKAVEKQCEVSAPTPEPEAIHVPENLHFGKIPDLPELGLEYPDKDQRAVLDFKGGEEAAWERLQHYFWQTDQISTYKETRNGMIGADYSSKFSPWLAQGCISPVSIYHELKHYEKQRTKNQSTYWLFFELLWRDFFRFTARKEQGHFFRVDKDVRISIDERFEKWCRGETGQDFIDGHMKELWHTGFMSNRGRQNVASYLVNDLEQHWYAGAQWFESRLIDYDVCSNYGNWAYVVGVGHDPRKDRYFNPESQAGRYDPDGKHAQLWNTD